MESRDDLGRTIARLMGWRRFERTDLRDRLALSRQHDGLDGLKAPDQVLQIRP
ncbi:MAG: hypothetical protein KIS66_04460 [Fimbriimonadaceae bacterium]|nr:hypothetical protein [Fimbriimonadaceae bacterium]